jgi:hypothetical protein
MNAVKKIICLLVLALAMLPAASASAGSTHLFLHQFTLDGSPQPFGVDHEGNLYVLLGGKIGKFSPEGDPVNFSALAENRIDGVGGSKCPTVPSDCDATPTNGFNAPSAALDTSGGPTDGYIYVGSFVNTSNSNGYTRVQVFDKTGKYLGELDQTGAVPDSCVSFDKVCQPRGMSLDADGHIYLSYVSSPRSHIDEYAPIDANPAHDRFIGELQPSKGPGNVFAGTKFLYVRNGSWQKYSTALFHERGAVAPVDFSPEPGPFGEFNGAACTGLCYYSSAAIDPVTEDIYLLNGGGAGLHPGHILQFSENNEQIGAPFGAYQVGDINDLAIDHSGGPTDGNIYAAGSGSNTIVVFSGPVPIADATVGVTKPGHTSVEVSADIDLAGGPEVTECRVDYGPGYGYNFFTSEKGYESTTTCSPAPPYAGNTHITANLTGLNASQQYHFRVVVTNANGPSRGEDHITHTEAVLGVETGDASNVTPSSAELNGSLDPDGIPTEYHFEYGIDTGYGTVTPTEFAGSGSGTVQVGPVPIAGLQAGRTYHYRLVATNNLGTSAGADRTVRAARRPAIAGLTASDLTETSAVLRGRIDTGGADTSYHFNYGPTPAYGSSVPVPDGQLAASGGDQAVNAQISGLRPGVTYHYQLVAANKWGMTKGDDATFSYFPPEDCPNALIRQETSAGFLPDCRAYEIVSPAAAGSIQLYASDSVPGEGSEFPIVGPPANTGAAISPSRFGFYGAFGSAPGTQPPNSTVDFYVSTRTDHGWVTTYPGLKSDEALLVFNPHCSSALDQCFDFHEADLNEGGNPFDHGSGVAYLWNVDGSSAGRLPTNADSVPSADVTVGDKRASADFNHYVFSSRNVRFTPDGVIGSPGSAYDNDLSTGTVTLISLDTNGDPIAQEPSNAGDGTEFIQFQMVSNDGSHILMSTADRSGCAPEQPGCPALLHLYMRVDDSITYDVSGGRVVHYVGATENGSKVFFTSGTQMTGDDTDNSVDLYMWQESDDSITLLSQGNGNGNSDSCATSWTEACDVKLISSDRPKVDKSVSTQSGDVYFYSPEQLDPANPGILNQRNLYLYRDGTVRYVTTLDPGSSLTRFQVTPDGLHAAFITTSRLTAYDNADYKEMYTYDVAEGEVACVSCIPSGQPPYSDVRGASGGLYMTNDGRTFFTTADALAVGDTNGLYDVYEFVDGRPQLITSGTGSIDKFGGSGALLGYPTSIAGLEAVSSDGTDVYFSTFETFVSGDRNGPFFKFYDARTGGGFAEAKPALPCTAADECHGQGGSPPAELNIGTEAQLGTGGNQVRGKAKKNKHRKHRRHRRSRHKDRGGKHHG